MHQNTPIYNSNIHFGLPGFLVGALGGQNRNIAMAGVILEIGHRSFSIFALFLYVEHHCDTGILNF